jgi:23S rRNA (guanosine2251-2'-O)-methyltransferase
VLELLRAGSPVEKIFMAEESAPSDVLEEIKRRAAAAAVPVRVVPRTEVAKLAGGENHQGVVAQTGRFRYADLPALLETPGATLLFLDGVTDPHNLGSLIRSAEVAGFTGIVIPARRAVGVTATVRRISAGASEVVPIARATNLSRALDQARAAGLWLVGLDEEAGTDIWASNLLEPPVGLVLGAEDRGMGRTVRERCDDLLRIPLAGRLESLNVAVAGAVAMFEVARRRAGSVSGGGSSDA